VTIEMRRVDMRGVFPNLSELRYGDRKVASVAGPYS
jgi:hypothetical protein